MATGSAANRNLHVLAAIGFALTAIGAGPYPVRIGPGRTDANVGAVVAGSSYRRPSFMARWGLSAYSHFTFARAHPEGTLRESCMRENRTCSLSGGRRPAWPQGLRASSDPTPGRRQVGIPLQGS